LSDERDTEPNLARLDREVEMASKQLGIRKVDLARANALGSDLRRRLEQIETERLDLEGQLRHAAAWKDNVGTEEVSARVRELAEETARVELELDRVTKEAPKAIEAAARALDQAQSAYERVQRQRSFAVARGATLEARRAVLKLKTMEGSVDTLLNGIDDALRIDQAVSQFDDSSSLIKLDRSTLEKGLAKILEVLEPVEAETRHLEEERERLLARANGWRAKEEAAMRADRENLSREAMRMAERDERSRSELTRELEEQASFVQRLVELRKKIESRLDAMTQADE
jgi:hypothetical protein